MSQPEPKYVKGNGKSAPDLKLVVGAYMTVTYWQADPENNQQSTINIINDGQSDAARLTFHPSHAAQLADVLAFIHQQIN